MIVDELIVVLGLDARKFTEGQRDAVAAFKKGKEGAIDFGKTIEESGMRMTDVFSTLKKGIVGVVAGLAGGEVMTVVNRINEMDAATGRWAKTINTSVPNLSAWQGMVRQVGGAAGEATSALSTLQQTINSVRQGSGMFEGGFASLMNQAGVSIGDDADASLRKIQKYISGQVGAGKMRPDEAATFLQRVPGMNQNMINVMLSDLDKLEAAARKAGTATKESADEAIKYQESLNQLSLSAEGLERVLTIKLTPSLVSFFDRTKQIIQEFSNGQFISPDSWLGKLLGVASGKSTTPMSGVGASTGTSGPGGTTRGDRNNNPGNMEYGAFARAHGATGSDGRFAVFPDWATGSAAQQSLVSGKSYAGLTLHEFASRYAEGAPAWERTVGGALGIGPNDIVNNQDPRLVEAIRRAEGTGARGSAASRSSASGNRTSTSSSEVNIGSMHINAPNATDADGIAGEVGGALKRQSMIAPANNGLV